VELLRGSEMRVKKKLKFWRGEGGLQKPLWNRNSEGVGGSNEKTFHGGVMDIFWNCTI